MLTFVKSIFSNTKDFNQLFDSENKMECYYYPSRNKGHDSSVPNSMLIVRLHVVRFYFTPVL